MYDLFLIVGFIFSIAHVSYWGYKHNQLLREQERLEEIREHNRNQAKILLSWCRTLEHREKVWKEFKQKVDQDLKWKWKI